MNQQALARLVPAVWFGPWWLVRLGSKAPIPHGIAWRLAFSHIEERYGKNFFAGTPVYRRDKMVPMVGGENEIHIFKARIIHFPITDPYRDDNFVFRRGY